MPNQTGILPQIDSASNSKKCGSWESIGALAAKAVAKAGAQ